MLLTCSSSVQCNGRLRLVQVQAHWAPSLSAQHLFLALEALHTLLCQDNRHGGLKQAQTGELRCVCGRYRKALHHQTSLYEVMTNWYFTLFNQILVLMTKRGMMIVVIYLISSTASICWNPFKKKKKFNGKFCTIADTQVWLTLTNGSNTVKVF